MKTDTTKKKTVIKTAKIIRPVKATPMHQHSVEDLIGLITEAIQFKYSGDKTTPGLTLAKLRNGKVYVSIVRFNAPFGRDKKVEYKASHTTLLAALHDVANQIVSEKPQNNPVEQLLQYLISPTHKVMRGA